MTIDDVKKALRKQASATRKIACDAMPDAAQRLASFDEMLVAHYAPQMVAAYWPIRTEIDPVPLLAKLCQRAGIKACLPVTPEEGKPLVFHEWDIGAPLAEGPYNTREPDGTSPVAIPQLILAPLLAFDAACWRLGYGGGFYDRTLAALEAGGHQVHVVGIAFDDSQVEQVPTGPYDKPLSAILTPSGLRHPASLP